MAQFLGAIDTQTSTNSKSPGDVLAISVSTFRRQARLTWQVWQAQPSAWGGPSRLAKVYFETLALPAA